MEQDNDLSQASSLIRYFRGLALGTRCGTIRAFRVLSLLSFDAYLSNVYRITRPASCTNIFYVCAV